ncbi:M48 family metalloprotease [Sediminitomix flava]|uniref:Putative Zn-dependent protease n=1 Tax=Sediminitomix flava TaxID=379075 RepID=A0A315ZES0_SEDFL|nr:M48 family metalloprotease [Sediminitomix flava]PWJ43328.1 putative Zn-dependent protease [Sediminitomix flava]
MRFLTFVLIFLFNSFLSVSQSIDLDKKLGQENAQAVAREMGIYPDAIKTAYLQRVGERLVAELDKPLFDYQFQIVPDEMPNAFALPGGYIYVTTGIIPLLETEDELACIIGHEIIHSNHRHTIKQMKKSILPKLLEVPGNILGIFSRDLGALFNAPIQTSNALLFASYGRKFETEADVEGIKLAAKAGYDPSAMNSILGRMSSAIEVATGNEEKKSYFNDHPYTPDRISKINKEIHKLKDSPRRPHESSDFLYEWDSLVVGDSPLTGICDANQFIHPVLDFSIIFPEGWIVENKPETLTAIHPQHEAALVLALDSSSVTPEAAGQAFLDSIPKEYAQKMDAAEVYEVEGKKGYLISFSEKTAQGLVHAYVLWLPLGEHLFKIIGITPIKYRYYLEKSVGSLRTLTSEEKNDIKYKLLRVGTVLHNESLNEFVHREENILKDSLTVIINDKKEISDPLEPGEHIKVVREEKYNLEEKAD